MTRRVLRSALLIMVWSGSAHAQSAGAQAEVLFRQGRDLMSQGKTAEACAAFEASQKLEAAVTTLLNHAGCREKNGQLASAWGLFLEAARLTRGGTDDDTKQLHDVAQSRAQKLEPRVSKLTLDVANTPRPDGFELLRGMERIEPAMWTRAIPIDGGTHTLVARAPGHIDWTTQIAIKTEGDSQTVPVPALEKQPEKVPEDDPAPPPVEVKSVVSPNPVDTTAPPRRVVPVALGAAAIGLLAGGIGFELWARSRYEAAKAETTDQAHRDDLYDGANLRRYAAQGMAIAGIASAGVAIWFYLRDSSPRRSGVGAVMVVPSGGLVVVGAF